MIGDETVRLRSIAGDAMERLGDVLDELAVVKGERDAAVKLVGELNEAEDILQRALRLALQERDQAIAALRWLAGQYERIPSDGPDLCWYGGGLTDKGWSRLAPWLEDTA